MAWTETGPTRSRTIIAQNEKALARLRSGTESALAPDSDAMQTVNDLLHSTAKKKTFEPTPLVSQKPEADGTLPPGNASCEAVLDWLRKPLRRQRIVSSNGEVVRWGGR